MSGHSLSSAAIQQLVRSLVPLSSRRLAFERHSLGQSNLVVHSKTTLKSGLHSVITGIVVLLAIYALPAVFFYIPNAGLAAVIIHAVGDLITPPAVVYSFWRINPLEVLIFFAGVIVSKLLESLHHRYLLTYLSSCFHFDRERHLCYSCGIRWPHAVAHGQTFGRFPRPHSCHDRCKRRATQLVPTNQPPRWHESRDPDRGASSWCFRVPLQQ